MIHETALNTFNEVIQTASVMSTVLYIIHKNYPDVLKDSLFGRECLFSHDYVKQTMKTEKNTPYSKILTGFVDKSCTYRFKHLCPEWVLG